MTQPLIANWNGIPIPDLSHFGFTGFVPPSGGGSLGILVVGEAPGEHELAQGRPFVEYAPAGATLERVLRRLGISRDQLRITNVVGSRPPNNWLEGAPWETAAVEAYRPLLDGLIKEMKPKVIVALGNSALKRLVPEYGGKRTGITIVRGTVLQSEYGLVIPSYHPSFIVQGNQHLTGVSIFDMKKALEVARDGFTQTQPFYHCNPTLNDALLFERGYDPKEMTLAYDIETPESSTLEEEDIESEEVSYTILRISFSYGAGSAITLPWQEPYISVARRLLQTDGQKVGWNSHGFDDPRLVANGCAIGGTRYDAMDGWHFLQPALPRNLQFVTTFYWQDVSPWKHLSQAEPEYYSCKDADATFRCWTGVVRDLKAYGQWDIFTRHVVCLRPTLSRMSTNGLPLDPDKLAAFKVELEGKRDSRIAELQSLVPDEWKPIHPKKGYVKTPKEVQEAIDRHQMPLLPMSVIERETGMREIVVPAYVNRDKGGVELVEVKRWAKVELFNPNSFVQVLDYIKHRGHKVPIHRKRQKETTEDDALVKLFRKTKDPTYKLIRECRNITKVLGTFVDGWKAGSDGRVHSTPGFWGAMFRISWRRPNIAGTIKDKDEEMVAKGFRKCIVARPGHVLVETDWRGIEAVLVGYFAQDQEYMRWGRLGVHAYMTALVLHEQGETTVLPDATWSDEDLMAYFAVVKRDFPFEYDQNKHGVHLSNYGGTPPLMNEMFPESFPTRKAAMDWQSFYFSTVAKKVKSWQRQVIDQAGEGFLWNPYKYRLWFWNVTEWDGKKYHRLQALWKRTKGSQDACYNEREKEVIGKIRQLMANGLTIENAIRNLCWKLGEDAKSAVSFLPRDTAAGMLKDVLLQCGDIAEKGWLLSCTHDALLSEVPESEVDGYVSLVESRMSAPVALLGGLTVGVETKVGCSWDEEEMEVYHGQSSGV